jgi:hypothetical protein
VGDSTILTGLSTAFASFLLVMFFVRLLGGERRRPGTGTWVPSLHQSDRRRWYRRRGEATPVLMVGADGNRRLETRVIDRSCAGLRLDSPVAVPPDVVLLVRACRAPADSPWVPVNVRWCNRFRYRIEIGCRFVEPPASDVLAQFG